MKKLKVFGGALLVSATIGLCIYPSVLAENTTNTANGGVGTICEGVFVDDINIGGMTAEQAKSAIEAKGTQIGKTTVTVSANSKQSKVTMKALGYQIKADDCIDSAVNIGNKGNLIQRYKDVSDAKNGKKKYESTYDIDESLVEKFVNEDCKKCDSQPVEPSMDMSSGKPTVIKGQDGQEIDKADTLAKLKEKLSKWDKNEVVIEAKVEVKKPKVSTEELQQCTSLIGACTTNINSSAESIKNMKRGTQLVNGSVVPAGETFSIMSKMRPFTPGNGYCESNSFANGTITPAMGGGICQVSTTLYDAALEAELEIVARRCHSSMIGYVQESFDAMVNDGTSDMKFKNTTGAPLYIQGYVSGGQMTFNIYGKETRDPNREIKFKNAVQVNGDVTTAQLYKYVYVNGVQQGEPQQINSSTYKKLKPSED